MIFPGKGIYAKGVLGLRACLKKMSTAVKPPCSNSVFVGFVVLKATFCAFFRAQASAVTVVHDFPYTDGTFRDVPVPRVLGVFLPCAAAVFR